jgi:hypothetical protein
LGKNAEGGEELDKVRHAIINFQRSEKTDKVIVGFNFGVTYDQNGIFFIIFHN